LTQRNIDNSKKTPRGHEVNYCLVTEIKLLEEMTFYFSLIVNAYGEVTVIYQMQEMIEYMSEKFASTRQMLSDLMEKRRTFRRFNRVTQDASTAG
jgi:hypothetical protein